MTSEIFIVYTIIYTLLLRSMKIDAWNIYRNSLFYIAWRKVLVLWVFLRLRSHKRGSLGNIRSQKEFHQLDLMLLGGTGEIMANFCKSYLRMFCYAKASADSFHSLKLNRVEMVKNFHITILMRYIFCKLYALRKFFVIVTCFLVFLLLIFCNRKGCRHIINFSLKTNNIKLD